MIKYGSIVYAISVDIQKEEDWLNFIGLANWFIDDAPIDEIKQHCLSHPGWVHFLDIEDYKINGFMLSDEWQALRDSGLAVAMKRCPVLVKGYVSPNDTWTRHMG